MQTLPVFIQSLGWTMLHAIWQSLAVFVIFKIADYALPRQQAKAKYALGLTALFLLTAGFMATFLLQWQHWLAINTIANTADTIAKFYPVTHTVNTGYVPATKFKGLFTLLGYAEHYFPFIAMAYVMGMAIMLFRLMGGSVKYFQLRNRNITTPHKDLNLLLKKLCLKLNITKNIQLKLSATLKAPVMAGWLKPAIILPVAMMNNISPDAMEAILLHELAHISRHDFLVNIFQVIAETILFFNPLAWHLSGYISREREHCCDDVVVLHTGQPLVYAKTLASIATEAYAKTSLALAANGNTNKPMILFNRIKRITEMKKQPFNYGRLTAALLITGLMLGMVLRFMPAEAQGKQKTGKTVVVHKKLQNDEHVTDEAQITIDTGASAITQSSIDTYIVTRDAAYVTADDDDYKAQIKQYRKDIAAYKKEMAAYAKSLKEFSRTDIDKELAAYKKELEEYRRDLVQYQKEVAKNKPADNTFPPMPPSPPGIIAPIAPLAPLAPMSPAPMPPVANTIEMVIDELTQDKKINPDNFDVSLNETELIIDGKAQPAQVHKKYFSLLNSDGTKSMKTIKRKQLSKHY